MTAFLTIQTALLAAMNSGTPLAGGRISTNKQRAIPTGQSTAIVLRLDQSEGSEVVIGGVDWNTAFSVECYARGSTASTEMVAAVDTLLSDTWARLTALTVGQVGADITVDPRIDWQYDDGDTPLICAVIRLTAAHRTGITSLTPWN